MNNCSSWSVLKILRWTSFYMESLLFNKSRLEIEILLSYVMSVDRLDLYLKKDLFLSFSKILIFVNLLNRRVKREPLFYLIGNREFWSMNFKINDDVLIPRPETECLIASLFSFLDGKTIVGEKKVLELGSGSGIIINTLAKFFSGHKFQALDISLLAMNVTKNNAIKCGLANDIKFLHSYWMDSIKPGSIYFDIIISNPPYVSEYELENLNLDISLYEPLLAIDGGVDGLFCLREIIKTSLLYLKIGGFLILEIGQTQGGQIKEFVNSCNGYSNITIIKDYSGTDRVVFMMKS